MTVLINLSLPTPITTFNVGQGANVKAFTIQSALLRASPVLSANAMRFMIEGETGVINLPEDDPEIFGMVHYFLETASLFSPVQSINVSPEMLVELFVMADKYRLLDLEEAIVQAISTQMTDKLFLVGIKILCDIYDVGIVMDKELQSAIDSYLYEGSLAATRGDVTEINEYLGDDDDFLGYYLSAFYDAQSAKQSHIQLESDQAIQELKAKVSALEDNNSRLESQKADLETEVQSVRDIMHAENERVENASAKTDLKMQRLKWRVDSLREANDTLKDTIRRLKDEDDSLEVEDVEDPSSDDDEFDEGYEAHYGDEE